MAVESLSVYGSPALFTADSGAFPATQALDGTTDGIACIFMCPKDGSIDRVGVFITAVNGSSPTYILGLESLTGDEPSGSYLGGVSPASVETTLSAGYNEVSLDFPFTVAAGAVYALTVRHASGTADGVNNVVAAFERNSVLEHTLPYPGRLDTGSWTMNSSGENAFGGVRYDDGQYVPGLVVESAALSNETYNSGSSPGYRGLLWEDIPFDCDIVGAQLHMRTGAVDWDIECYLNASGSADASSSTSSDYNNVNGQQGYRLIMFDPVSASAGDDVRLILRPTSGSNIAYNMISEFPNADALTARNPGMCYTTASTPGTWTDYNNGTDGYKACQILPVIQNISTGGGGGGGVFLPNSRTVGL